MTEKIILTDLHDFLNDSFPCFTPFKTFGSVGLGCVFTLSESSGSVVLGCMFRRRGILAYYSRFYISDSWIKESKSVISKLPGDTNIVSMSDPNYREKIKVYLEAAAKEYFGSEKND